MRLKSLFSRFQSTLPREERHRFPDFRLADQSFQSTLPREERHILVFVCTTNHLNFNPRSHERSDTAPGSSAPSLLNYFNPRSHERSDTDNKINPILYFYFNPRSHERSDSNIAQKICLFLYNTDNKYIIR